MVQCILGNWELQVQIEVVAAGEPSQLVDFGWPEMWPIGILWLEGPRSGIFPRKRSDQWSLVCTLLSIDYTLLSDAVWCEEGHSYEALIHLRVKLLAIDGSCASRNLCSQYGKMGHSVTPWHRVEFCTLFFEVVTTHRFLGSQAIRCGGTGLLLGLVKARSCDALWLPVMHAMQDVRSHFGRVAWRWAESVSFPPGLTFVTIAGTSDVELQRIARRKIQVKGNADVATMLPHTYVVRALGLKWLECSTQHGPRGLLPVSKSIK